MIEYKIKKPSLDEFHKLRDSVDWNLKERGISDERAQESLDKAPFCICAYDEDEIIGMVRLSGDSGMYGYIQDTIVLPKYQGRNIGTEMMNRLMDFAMARPGYLLGVCPSKVSVKFYESFGFKKRPENPNGFMYVEVK